jgi:hypothetical protein
VGISWIGGTVRGVCVSLLVILAGMVSAETASANSVTRTVTHVDDTSVDHSLCSFGVTFHTVGSFTETDFYDNTGFLYKSLFTVGPGPFRITATAKGTTLTDQNESFSDILTYNPDGSVKTETANGPFNKFTAPGRGIVWLDTGHIITDGDGNVLFVSGPRQNGDFTAFCAAFG